MICTNLNRLLVIVLAVLALCVLCFSAVRTNQTAPSRDALLQPADQLEEEIPKYAFGGTYWDDSSILIVHVKAGISLPQTNVLSSALAASVKSKTVEYSLSELEALKAWLGPYMLEYSIPSMDASKVANAVDIQSQEDNDGLYALIQRSGLPDPEATRVSVLENVQFSRRSLTHLWGNNHKHFQPNIIRTLVF